MARPANQGQGDCQNLERDVTGWRNINLRRPPSTLRSTTLAPFTILNADILSIQTRSDLLLNLIPSTILQPNKMVKPTTCCGRSNACICAQKATCTCGKQSAMHCTCDKKSSENSVHGARCSCRMSIPSLPSTPPKMYAIQKLTQCQT